MQSELEDIYCIYCYSFGIQKSRKMARHDTTQKQRDSLGLGDAKAEQSLGLGQVVQIFSGVHRPVHSTEWQQHDKRVFQCRCQSSHGCTVPFQIFQKCLVIRRSTMSDSTKRSPEAGACESESQWKLLLVISP